MKAIIIFRIDYDLPFVNFLRNENMFCFSGKQFIHNKCSYNEGKIKTNVYCRICVYHMYIL